MTDGPVPEYPYRHGGGALHHEFIFPVLKRWLSGSPGPVLDLGCGNGSLTARVKRELAVECVGVDSSRSGMVLAHQSHSGIPFLHHSVSDPLPPDLQGRFQAVIAVELIEHLFLPAQLFERAREAMVPGGELILSTPYHGYLKNVAIAVSGRFDRHVDPLWDFGHIKFFSPRTLTRLAAQAGWRLLDIDRVGRVKPLAKAMVARFALAAR